MASFFTSLLNSIFTPGPTPVLLLATNISFGGLQLVLALLLVFTRSVHFAILSLLSGGLWWAINWFAAELRAVEGVEREAKAIRERDEKREKGEGGRARVPQQQERGEEGEEEEGPDRTDEDQAEGRRGPGTRRRDESGNLASPSGAGNENGNGNEIERIGGSEVASSTSELDLARGRTEGVRKRRIASDTPGDLSTDSEWDKVSEVEDLDR